MRKILDGRDSRFTHLHRLICLQKPVPSKKAHIDHKLQTADFINFGNTASFLFLIPISFVVQEILCRMTQIAELAKALF
jgi:hypothetical protein